MQATPLLSADSPPRACPTWLMASENAPRLGAERTAVLRKQQPVMPVPDTTPARPRDLLDLDKGDWDYGEWAAKHQASYVADTATWASSKLPALGLAFEDPHVTLEH